MTEPHLPHFVDAHPDDPFAPFELCCPDAGHCRDCGGFLHLTRWDGDGQRYCCCCMSGGRRYCDHTTAGQ